MKVTSESDKVTISEEHDEYGWFTKDEVADMIKNKQLTQAAINAFSK